MKIPTDRQLRSDAGFLGFTDADVDRLIVHARRARTGSTDVDGYKSSHGAAGGGRPSGISDPTCDMATSDERATPEIEKQHRLLFDMLDQAASSKRAVRNTLERLGTIQTWAKPAGQTAPECKTVDCDGVSVARGLCNACRMYVDRLKEKRETDGLPPFDVDPIVPATVIASRGKRKGQAA